MMANLSTKFVFIAFIVASTGIALADESFDIDSEELALRYKRASMITAYSLGSTTTCGYVGSAGTYCGVKYQVPSVIAHFAGQLAKDEKLLIHAFVNNPKLPVSTQCAAEIKQFFCDAFYPVCNAANKTVTYNLKNCAKVGASCPKEIYAGFHKLGTCKILPSGTYTSSKCVKPLSSGTKLCPKPHASAKVPAWLIHEMQMNDNSAQNLKTALVKGNTSASCTANMVNFICSAQPFCSTDGKLILTTATKNRCNAAINCLPVKLRQALHKYMDCTLYPDSQTAKAYKVPANSVISGALGFSHNAITLWTFLGILVMLFLK